MTKERTGKNMYELYSTLTMAYIMIIPSGNVNIISSILLDIEDLQLGRHQCHTYDNE